MDMGEGGERDAGDDDFLTLETTDWRGTRTERMTREEAKRRGLLGGKPISLDQAARLGSKAAKDELHPVVGSRPTVPRVALGAVLGGPIGALIGFAWRKKDRA